MKIKDSSLKLLDKIGVYKIENLINNKVYIGSTQKCFIERFSKHYSQLIKNKHKGYWHLQNAVNEYGIENFEFSILEICEKEKCFQREEDYIAIFDACNREKGYNFKKKPNGSPMQTQEVIEKMKNTLKEKYKNGEIKLSNTVFKKGKIPWNKGIFYDSTDHLKVPKKKKGSREKFSQTIKEKQIPIDVFNLKGDFLKSFRYIQDIISDSKDNNSIICKEMILKNPNGRNGYNPFELFSVNIQKSCRTGKPYKGLIFKYNAVAHNKSDKLLENP